MNNFKRHYEENITIPVSANEVFDFADNHENFSSHMNKFSLMMFGGKINTEIDSGEGKKVGSHIRMNGTIVGIKIFLDEVVTGRQQPYRKKWETIGNPRLIVIGHYKMGFEIKSQNNYCQLKIYIDYDLSKSFYTYGLSYLFSKVYAKWCVGQMINRVKENFNKQILKEKE